MKIEFIGSSCANCSKYTQFYKLDGDKATPVDRGYCETRQCVTRTGNRCKYHQEKPKIKVPLGLQLGDGRCGTAV